MDLYIKNTEIGAVPFSSVLKQNEMPWGSVSTNMYFKPSTKDVHAYVTNINFL